MFQHYRDMTAILGNTAEINFKNRCISKGLLVKDATRNENIYKHCDFWVSKNGTNYSIVDVKAKKSIRRGQEPSSSHVAIELVNGYNYKGWIYSDGYIAFENVDGKFYICSKADLLKYTLIKVNINDYIYDTNDISLNISYKLFRRKKYNKHEIITYITWDDVKKLTKEIL